jgi:hypothetical protein
MNSFINRFIINNTTTQKDKYPILGLMCSFGITLPALTNISKDQFLAEEIFNRIVKFFPENQSQISDVQNILNLIQECGYEYSKRQVAYYALCNAAMEGNLEIVKLFLSVGVDYDYRSYEIPLQEVNKRIATLKDSKGDIDKIKRLETVKEYFEKNGMALSIIEMTAINRKVVSTMLDTNMPSPTKSFYAFYNSQSTDKKPDTTPALAGADEHSSFKKNCCVIL